MLRDFGSHLADQALHLSGPVAALEVLDAARLSAARGEVVRLG